MDTLDVVVCGVHACIMCDCGHGVSASCTREAPLARIIGNRMQQVHVRLRTELLRMVQVCRADDDPTFA